jgi:outer membrane protein OmpA-like peptidoglycan-associated protein
MSVMPPDDIDVLDLDELDQDRSGPVRRPRRPSPPSQPPPSGPPLTDPRFLVPFLLFLAAVFVIGMAVRSGGQTDDAANDQEVRVQSELALAVRDAELRAGFGDLTITEDDGSLIIEGQARDPFAAASIGAVARSVEGTQRVDNRVVVLDGALETATQESLASVSTGTLDEQLASVGQITFEAGSAALTPEGSVIVDSVASLLSQSRVTGVEVHGHTDSDGDEIRNQVLSQERAEAVVVALTERGLDPARLTAVGFGESRPIGPNITEGGRAVNRRIEFIIVG